MSDELKYLGFMEAYKTAVKLPLLAITSAEVDEIEQAWGVKLPLAYRELLMTKGRLAGFAFHDGMEYGFNEYADMQKAVKYFVSRSVYKLELDENVFVFSYSGEADMIWFFRLNEGENPPVYMLSADADHYEKVADNFSELIKTQSWYQFYVK